MSSFPQRLAALAPVTLLVSLTSLAIAPQVMADGAPGSQEDGYHPWVHYPQVRSVDMSEQGITNGDYISQPPVQPDLHALDAYKMTPEQMQEPMPTERTLEDAASVKMADGWVQQGNVVLPAAVADGLKDVSTGPIYAVEDIPGNKYPRKHSLFLNFNGGMLFTGSDNSAENRSTLARQGVYPTFGGGESIALSIIQSVEADLSQFGVRVLYMERPRNLVPYTMEMVGGTWMDTNLDSPAGGVAPGADCGALGQRHVVYTFSNGGSVLGAASTISQEAGHAWGLDHTVNCGSVMSYCGSGDQSFQTTCDGLCENQCQGAAGCRLTHEMFCGEGNDQQNDLDEMQWIFGGNEPDMEPPTVEIVSPVDGLELEAGESTQLRAIVDDNYGGFGWKFVVRRDGEVVYDQPDYDRDVDAEFRAGINLTSLEAGVYELTVEAEDQYNQITAQTVTIYVGGASTTTDPGAMSTGDDSGATESGGLGTGASGGPGGDDPDPKGCGCSAGSGQGALGSLLLVLGFGWFRRRK